MSELSRISVQALLPNPVERRMERWSRRTVGASWPVWGGHISLLPMSTTGHDVASIGQIISQVCAGVAPFPVRFACPVAKPDWTRPEYHAVFLDMEDEQDPGFRDLVELQRKLKEAIGALLSPVNQGLATRQFSPHVTGALGLSEDEAADIVRAMRVEGLRAEFDLREVWMLEFEREGNHIRERHMFRLANA